MERIALAREYRVAEWLRDAYLELTRMRPLNLDELQPAEPYSNPLDRNWEADSKESEVTFRHWETLARICRLQAKVASKATYTSTVSGICFHCSVCGMTYGMPCRPLCECRLLVMVDEEFREELESFRENSGNNDHFEL
jgi:hypothetical protein